MRAPRAETSLTMHVYLLDVVILVFVCAWVGFYHSRLSCQVYAILLCHTVVLGAVLCVLIVISWLCCQPIAILSRGFLNPLPLLPESCLGFC